MKTKLLIAVCLAIAFLLVIKSNHSTRVPESAPQLRQQSINSGSGDPLLQTLDPIRYSFRSVKRNNVDSYLAVNHSQQLRLWIDSKGMTVTPSAVPGDSKRVDDWSLNLKLRESNDQAVAPLPVVEKVKDTRIDLTRRENAHADRQTSVAESYENTTQGIKQIFTVNGPTSTAGEPLRLVMSLDGSLTAHANENSLKFFNSRNEPVLTYGQVTAVDARGNKLHTRVQAHDSQIEIEVDDKNAVRPLQVAPLMMSEQIINLPVGSTTGFGFSVDLTSTTMVVGARWEDVGIPNRVGAVYILRRDHLSRWIFIDRLIPDSTEPAPTNLEFQFGTTVAISGETIAVGAPSVPIGACQDNWTGFIHVYRKHGQKYLPEAVIPAVSSAAVMFGHQIALNGDTIVAGSMSVCHNTERSGHVNVFVRQEVAREGGGSQIVWTIQADLQSGVPPPGESYEAFGYSVGVSGDTLVAGGAPAGTGVMMFTRTNGVWGNRTEIKPPEPLTSPLTEGFGSEVAISGDRMIIGANRAGPSAANNSGAAYIFEKEGNVWVFKQRLTPSDAQPQQNFGQAVDISGNRAVVGVQLDDYSGLDNPGSAYVFDRGDDGVWRERAKLNYSDPHSQGVFGASIATNGSQVAVGAPLHGVNGVSFRQGQVYVYAVDDLDGDGLPDDVELNGLTVDGNHVDLKAMGASPFHKDIFIHCDWMNGRKPDPRSIQMVIDAFAKAPVRNPDNKPGINLHIDLGPGSKMNKNKTWGSLSKAGQIDFQENTGSFTPAGYNWNDVDAIKAEGFDLTGRSSAFHYVLFANQTSSNAAGLHRGSPGADSVIFMSEPENRNVFTAAIVFMHELGHRLGLDHGGLDSINRKPNYLSIMNYAFADVGVLSSTSKKRKIDFSRIALPALNEIGVEELPGIQDPDKHLTLWGIRSNPNQPPGSNKCIANDNFYKIFLPGQELDWDCNGVKTTDPVIADVNSDGLCVRVGPDHTLETPECFGSANPNCDDQIIAGGVVAGDDRRCDTVAKETDRQWGVVGEVQPDQLFGFNDWANLDFLGGGRIGNLAYDHDDPEITPPRTKLDEGDHDDKTFDIPSTLLAENTNSPLDNVTLTPDEGPAPLTVNFDGSTSIAVNGTIVSWEWDFGDGATATGATTSHTYTTPGEYFATLNVTDSNGNVNLVPLQYLITVDSPAATPTPTPTEQPTPTPSGTPGASDVDPTFEANVSGNFSTQIKTIVTQPDGKILVGGDFESFAGCARQGIARLNPDGSCDTSFNPGMTLSVERITGTLPFRVKPPVRAIALQPDGKILVGLAYEKCCGTQPGKMIVRLNSDGTLDSTFNLSGLGSQGNFDANVYGIAVQPDGRVLIVGSFAFEANGAFGPNTALANVARLNQNGSLDTTFNASTGTLLPGGPFKPDDVVNAVAVQADGKILIGGRFRTVGGNVSRIGIARLNSDGSNDSTYDVQDQSSGNFSSELSQNTNVFVIALQPDGKAVIGGDLRRGNQNEAFMRLNTNGSRDSSFASGAAFGVFFVSGRSLAIQPDGKIVIAGDFRITSTPSRNYIARLNSDGTLDTTFDTGTGTQPPNGGSDPRNVDTVALQTDGKVIFGGRFEFYKDQAAPQILRLDATGNRDAGFNSRGPGNNGEVNVVVRQPDQKLLVGYSSIGSSKSILLNAHRSSGIGRLNPDGSTDTSFTSPFDHGSSSVFAIAVQQDGKIIAGGTFRLQGSTTQIYLVRLNTDGSLDSTFSATPNDQVQAILIQADGKIVVGGSFTSINSTTQFRLARLNTNGSVDQTFASNGVGGTVRTLVEQPDGKIIVAGNFNGLNSTLRNNIARINASGSLDNSFDPDTGPDGGVVPVVVQPDGKLLIGGFFQNYNGVARPFLARLETNGQLDTSFNPVNPAQRVVNALALQADGKIYAGCSSSGTVANASPPNTIFRLNSDGSLDASLPAHAEIELDVESRISFVNTVFLDQDERLIIGGKFDVVNDAAHLALARLLTKDPSSPTPTPTPTPTPEQEPSPTPFPTPAPTSTFQFAPVSYSVNEDCTAIPITVTRTGILTSAASVTYATADVTASGRSDYTIALGTLFFAPGETSKTFPVLISEDSLVEGNETFNVKLTTASGAGLGSAHTASVQIVDDPAEPTTNAIDDAPTYVCQHYHDFLNRQPDAAGLAFWTNEITSCGNDQQCIETKRINVSAAFYLSIEYQQTGYFVERTWLAAFGDGHGLSRLDGPSHSISVPIVRRDDLLIDSQRIGQGVVVGEPGWEQRIEQNKQAFIADFAKRHLVTLMYPLETSPAEFVDRLFANAGITPTGAERNAAIAEFGNTGITADTAARGRVLRMIGESATINTSQFNKAFVLMQYIGYLRRNPDDPQDMDHTGYDFWLTKLDDFDGDFVRADMVKAFIVSTEYRSRFGLP